MTRGYFTITQNTDIDYVKHAYALALSLKATQKTSNLSIGVPPGYVVPENWRWAFDQVIEFPWGDHAEDSEVKFENEWKVIHMSPYDETIKIEADMLVPASIDHWWDILAILNRDLLFTSNVYSYRGDLITNRYTRALFDTQGLPDLYNGLMYFKKTRLSFAFFKMAEEIFKNWETFYADFFDHRRPDYVSTDHVFALAAKLLGIQDQVLDKSFEIPKFTHMKFELTGWEYPYETKTWLDNVTVYLTDDLELKIGNYKQTIPFHYHEKDFLTTEIIKKYEEKLC